MIDLHVHSTFSDGSFTPEQLARMGKQAGLTAMALTDHDGMMGVEAFMAACQEQGLRGIPGVEISVDCKSGTLHMLGYFIHHREAGVESALAELRGGREDRNHRILERLNALGFALAWDEVAKFAGEDVVGRPHFAQALIEKGYVQGKDEAFDRLLGKGKPAYVDRYRMTAEDSIAMIRKAGGVPVLAHPFTLGMGHKNMKALLKDLADQGLQGIEAYYSEHDAEQQRFCLSQARELGLVVTGGSDFHGVVNPLVKLGIGFGSLNVPDDLVDKLHARRSGH
jgi:predicted metal-dependent phosphoesterase TrpH